MQFCARFPNSPHTTGSLTGFLLPFGMLCSVLSLEKASEEQDMLESGCICLLLSLFPFSGEDLGGV